MDVSINIALVYHHAEGIAYSSQNVFGRIY